MLRNVELAGYKGKSASYQLGRLNLLVGPNESGKSAVLEGIAYALTGGVPAGRALDTVAKYFPPRGGSVTLEIFPGYEQTTSCWLTRGVDVDLKKAKVSEVLQTRTPLADDEPDLGPWEIHPAVLDFRWFLALSADKRREFVLGLLEGGMVLPLADLLQTSATRYLREVAGPAARADLLSSADARVEAELPAEMAATLEAWPTIRAELESYGAARATQGAVFAAETIRVWLDAAKVALRDAQKRLREETAAVGELEAEARGSTVSATELTEADQQAEAADRQLVEAKAALVELVRRTDEHATVVTEIDCLGRDLREAEQRLDAMGDLEPVQAPDFSAIDAALKDSLREIDNLTSLAKDASDELEDRRRDIQHAAAIDAARQRDWEERERLRASVVIQLVTAVDALRGYAVTQPEILDRFNAISTLAHQLSSAQRARLFALDCSIAEHSERLAAAEEASEDAPGLEELERRRDEIATALGGLREAHVRRHRDKDRLLAAYTAKQLEIESLGQRRRQAEKRRTHLVGRLESLGDRLIDCPPVPDEACASAREVVVQLRLAATEADSRVKALHFRAGQRTAYDQALARMCRSQTLILAWKAAAKVLAALREQYVAEVTQPLIADIGRLMEATGRQDEMAYCRLENDRGLATFELGLCQAGVRVPVEALSGGAAAIFGAALTLAFAKQFDGLKLLLIEADTLDPENLVALCQALGSWQQELDGVLVATCHRDALDCGTEWTVIDVDGGS